MSQIAIAPARTLGTIDRKVFGGFVEHLGRCIYGGLYVSNYHWTDGIGPKAERPRRPELAWGGEEPNTFGTDEFLAYCAALGPEPDSVAPYICLNMGTGTLAEALAWVEYCNSARNTDWASQRRANGRREPYGVRYWALGNEMYGPWQVGHMTADEYVREATRWARAIRMLDPGAKLVACGETGLTEWDRIVVDGLAGLVDYHSIHIYTHRVADLGPFALVDASASVSADRRRIAVTLVNRSPDAADEASLVLRDFAFAGPASVTTLTDCDPSGQGDQSPLAADEPVVGSTALAITLPPRSFTVVEAAIAERRP